MDYRFGTMFSSLGSPQPCVTRLGLGDLGCQSSWKGRWLHCNILSFKGLVQKGVQRYIYHGRGSNSIVYKNMYTYIYACFIASAFMCLQDIIPLFPMVQGKAAGFDCVTKPRESGKASISASVCQHSLGKFSEIASSQFIPFFCMIGGKCQMGLSELCVSLAAPARSTNSIFSNGIQY